MTNKLSRRNFLHMVGAASAVSAVSAFSLTSITGVRAQAVDMVGRVFQFARGGVKIHTYVAPDASVGVTSHIIETDNALIVIDTQFLQTFAKEFKAYADSLGKPIDRVILSHAHPDHFLGANQFAESPFVTTQAIAAGLAGYIEAGAVAQVAGFAGESEVPAEVRPAEGSIEVGDEVIDGVTFLFSIVTNAEAPETIVVRLPQAGVIVLQDLVYNNFHFFPGQDRANWIAELETLRGTLEGYDTLLAGHGLPTTKGELDIAIQYLTFANDTIAETADAAVVIAALQAEYPSYEGLGLLPFWQQFLQPA
ncbi:MAG: MBL fold metallo-hydrolase [Chitinophagaceae bacterium]|nr:MBL fold metallo-hydrolase [Anaerolineae bacterium]